MPRTKQKVAIARILSDLIKSDNLIEPEEVEQYNRIISLFDIGKEELMAAQDITLTTAIKDVRELTEEDKGTLRKVLLDTANSDNACVAREALILLTLKLVLEDTDGKYNLISYDTRGSYTNDKYVVYLENDFMDEVNDEIQIEYDHISNLLKLWKFDFVYIPRLAEKFQSMDANYLRNIIRYMNPRLNEMAVESIYKKLTSITTEKLCRDLIANERGWTGINSIEGPTLLINIGTSVVPYCRQNDEGHTYTEFLTIRLDLDIEDCVLKEIRSFLEKYQDILTEPEYNRPDRRKNYFKYFGFYKTIFDFLSRLESNGVENDIVIEPGTRSILMQGEQVKLSPTELATYILILHQTICTHRNGLVKIGRHRGLTSREEEQITKIYQIVFNMFREIPLDKNKTYEDEYKNIRAYISRIRREIADKVRNRDVNTFSPCDHDPDDLYRIGIDPEMVFVKYYDHNNNPIQTTFKEYVKYNGWHKI